MNRMIGATCDQITFSGDILFILSILSISDLAGTDAARKLELIARAAFVDAPHIELHVCGIAGVTTSDVSRLCERGLRLKVVASCERREGHIRGVVKLQIAAKRLSRRHARMLGEGSRLSTVNA